MKTEIRQRLLNDMETVMSSGVNGLCKLFLYEHFVVRRLSWVFLVHDLNLSFAKELDKRVIPRLKEWAGLFRSSDTGTLFRLRWSATHVRRTSLRTPATSEMQPPGKLER